PAIGTQKYSVVLQDNGKVQVSRNIVSAWNRSHFNAQSGEWTYTAAWTTDTTFELNPFDIVFFKNESKLAMVEAAGAASGHISVVPAVFLQYADDKSFNNALLETSALALDAIALATGPGAIINAVEVGNVAVAAFEAFQFVGAVGNIAANGITDPDLQSLIQDYNMIVGIWGFSHLATSVGKFSVNYFTEVKVGEVKAIPFGTANDFNAKYALAESKLGDLPETERGQVEKMEEYFKEEGVNTTVPNGEILFINGWTKESILALPKGQRPNPNLYLSQSYIDNHLSLFSEGVTKFSATNPTNTIGPPGGTFVMPKAQADALILEANGSISSLENLLGLTPGELGNNPIRIDISSPSGLRMPNGNELGANNQWIPGGETSGGIPEATVDQIQPG
ncbi:MAG TPA: hypothetical protein VFJ43_08970, partial [Bacteroidia bacterium]|nr:hypothetical protein [Bacteroidia bacterium]